MVVRGPSPRQPVEASRFARRSSRRRSGRHCGCIALRIRQGCCFNIETPVTQLSQNPPNKSWTLGPKSGPLATDERVVRMWYDRDASVCHRDSPNDFTHITGTHLDDPRPKQRLCDPALVALRRSAALRLPAPLYLPWYLYLFIDYTPPGRLAYPLALTSHSH